MEGRRLAVNTDAVPFGQAHFHPRGQPAAGAGLLLWRGTSSSRVVQEESKKRFVTLISDVLLVGKPKSRGTYALKFAVPLHHAWTHAASNLDAVAVSNCSLI